MNKKTNYIVKSAMIAALYAVITIILKPISYGPIQFRLSEIFVLLVFIDKRYQTGLVLGCFLANLLSDAGIYDVVLGTMATFISLQGIIFIKNKIGTNLVGLFIASLMPVIANGIIIGWMLNHLFGFPLILTIGQVAFGEFVVVSILGVTIFNKLIISDKIIKKIEFE